MKQADEIDDVNALNSALILNKCQAIVLAGAGKYAELAKDLNVKPQRVSEWIPMRKYKPDADILFRMRNWASARTLGIATAGGNVQDAYRTAYLEVCKKFPVNGREK